MVLPPGLVRHPTTAAVMLLTLCIGTAVSAVIFTVAWAILFRSLPYRDPDRLAVIWASDPVAHIPKLELSWEEFERLRAAQTLETSAAYLAVSFTAVVQSGNEPLQLRSNLVTRDFFRTLGVQPARGRLFVDAEHQPGAALSLVLTWDAWQKHFGGDPDLLGRKLTAGPLSLEVVGVLPPHVELPRGAESLVPMEPARDPKQPTNRVLGVVAKRKAGVTAEQLAAELKVLSTRPVLLAAHPLAEELLGGTGGVVRVLFGMGMLVLLIALVNVAALALVRGTANVGDLAIRASVGGTRGAIAARRFLENLVLTAAACAAGGLVAGATLDIVLKLAPRTIPRTGEVDMGLEAVLFVAAAAVAAAALASLVQTYSVSERAMLDALRASSKSTGTLRARRTLELLAAVQVAVAIVTIVVASLLVESFRRLAAVDVGFSTRNVLTFHLPLGYSMSGDPDGARAFFDDLLPRLRAIPGVTAAGAVLMRPLEIEQGWDFDFTAEGQSADERERNPAANLLSATPGYFEAMGIATVYGRVFDGRDTPQSQRVAVIGESFARRYWRSPAGAIGKRVHGHLADPSRPWLTIVGVVKDVRSRDLTTEKLDIYVPFTQTNWSPNYLALRTSGDPEAVLPFARAAVAQLDEELPVVAVRTTADLVAAKLAQPRLGAIVVTIFAAAASLLALIGLYGVLAYGVTDRLRELGIRMAVGADGESVLALVLRRALLIAIAGALAGVGASLAAVRVWKSYVWGVDALNPLFASALAAAFVLAALAASAVPAVRAARTDAALALRAE